VKGVERVHFWADTWIKEDRLASLPEKGLAVHQGPAKSSPSDSVLWREKLCCISVQLITKHYFHRDSPGDEDNTVFM
jgi:hypothetical protein